MVIFPNFLPEEFVVAEKRALVHASEDADKELYCGYAELLEGVFGY